MLVRAPLVETQQDGSIRIANLTPVVMTRSRFGLPKKRLVPFEAARDVSDADDRPRALHRVSAVALTDYEQTRRDNLIREAFKSNLAFAITVFLRSQFYLTYRSAAVDANGTNRPELASDQRQLCGTK
jgi:hypothetical protein